MKYPVLGLAEESLVELNVVFVSDFATQLKERWEQVGGVRGN